MAIDVQRLGIERHVGEQHVVHLRDRARERVLVEMADHEIVEIEAAAFMAAQLGLLSHRLPPELARVHALHLSHGSKNQPLACTKMRSPCRAMICLPPLFSFRNSASCRIFVSSTKSIS